MSTAQPIIIQSAGPGCLVRGLWFLFLGWWLGGIVSFIAWLLILTIIGLPLGLSLINRLPGVITLRPQGQTWRIDERGILRQGHEQRPFFVRALYFILVGWWLSGIWLTVAYAFLVVIIGIPLSFWMYGRVGAITTLYRS
jgi:uncharacterized membrane protein YccF (DUF307 family)